MARLETLALLAAKVDPSVLALTIVIGLIAVYLYFTRRHEGVPPGPYPWPIVGNLWELSKDPRDNWPLLKAKYGDIFSLYMGGRLAVVLASSEVIKEAFIKYGDIFSDRPNIFVLTELGEGKGIIPASGELWREQRKFTANVLRDLGMTRSTMEDGINAEVSVVLKIMEESKGSALDLHHILQSAVTNIIFAILFGERFEHDNPEFIECIDAFRESSELLGSTGILNVFPWIRHLPGDLANLGALYRNKEKVAKFVTKILEEKKSSYHYGPPKTFIDAYLKKIKEEDCNKETMFTDDQLLKISLDFFFAGSETTSATLDFILAYLIKFPEMQTTMQAEVDEIVGKGRTPSLADRSSMPFTEAFISEVMRHTAVVPLGVVHTASENVDFRGYFIPKGTIIFPFLREAMHETDAWKDPDEFCPSRFIKDGKHSKPEQFVPFSVGRRTCLGEALARMELFLFLTGILQRFTIRLPEGATQPDVKGTLGITVMAPRFEICAEKRP